MVEFNPRIFKSLRSNNPKERKKGVKALARTGERAAMRYLATVYKEDPDPSVRALALDAGKHIKHLQMRGEWEGEGVKNPTREMMAVSSSVSDADQKQSKKYMDDAFEFVHQEEYDRAEELARQAFALNPNLKHDPYYVGIAGEVMGMAAEEAVEILLRNSQS